MVSGPELAFETLASVPMRNVGFESRRAFAWAASVVSSAKAKPALPWPGSAGYVMGREGAVNVASREPVDEYRERPKAFRVMDASVPPPSFPLKIRTKFRKSIVLEKPSWAAV